MYVNVWETLTFHLSNHLAYTRLLLMPVVCGVLFLLSMFCLMADKFCNVFCCQNSFTNSYSCVSVANSCHCQCEEFRSKHLASKQFAFSCRLFVMHPLCKGLYTENSYSDSYAFINRDEEEKTVDKSQIHNERTSPGPPEHCFLHTHTNTQTHNLFTVVPHFIYFSGLYPGRPC